MRRLCLFTVLIACTVSHAQTSSLRTQLERAYELGWNEDMEGAEAILSGISEEDILTEDDSTKYLFYYCMAGLLDYKEQSPELESEYIDKAIGLRETSVGVLSSEYLELLWAKGNDIYEQDVNQAIRIFEKGLVIGQSCLGSNDRSSLFWYGQIMSYLAECYKQKGYEKELVSLCNQSFNILAPHYDVEDEDDHTSLVPLTILEIYYWEQAKYNKNIELCDRALTFLSGHGGADTENYANFLYYKANSLDCLGRISEAAETYEKAADILTTRYGNKAELLQLVYSNWYIMLAENGMDDEAAEIEPALIECHTANKHTERTAITYTAVATFLCQMGNYAAALKYSEKADTYIEQLSNADKELVYHRRTIILYELQRYDEAIEAAKLAAAFSTTMDTRLKNECDVAYITSYIDREKSIRSYQSIIQGLDITDSVQANFYMEVVNGIYYILDKSEEYARTETFLSEQAKYVLSRTNQYNRIYPYILNGVGVAQLKQGKGKEGLETMKQVSALYEKIGVTDKETLSTLEHNLGRAYMLVNKDEDAYEHLMISAQMQRETGGAVMEKTQEYINQIESRR